MYVSCSVELREIRVMQHSCDVSLSISINVANNLMRVDDKEMKEREREREKKRLYIVKRDFQSYLQ